MGLPPFFAVLSNQIMERPYRMDKLSIAIGRWDAKVRTNRSTCSPY
jgi:hypothetical protein